MSRLRSLRVQLTLSAAVLAALVVLLAGVIIAVRIDHQDRAQVDGQLRARAAKVKADGAKAGQRGSLLNEDDKPEGARNDTNLLAGTDTLTRVLSGGGILAQRGEGLPSTQQVPAAAGLSTVEIEGQKWRSLVEPTTIAPNAQLQVLQSLEPVEQRLHDNWRLVAIVAAAATLCGAFATWLIAGLLLRPLERLRQGASTIRAGPETHEQLPEVGGQREVAELSATLNDMLERLQTSMQATRRFTADAGHEIRSPLAGLGMDLETLRRNPDLSPTRRAEMLDAMSREHARIVTLLDGLQRLARGDAAVLPDRTVFEIGDVLADALKAATKRAPSVTFRAGELASGRLQKWEDGIRFALDNLLDNAALHGNPDGVVEASVTANGSDLVVLIDDDGPGIAPEDRERLTQRFSRGADRRSPGSGLGLALVDQQARLHGGRLVLGDAPAGGLRAILTIPKCAPSIGSR
jgi:two-component system sensor histidine kinase PrrB